MLELSLECYYPTVYVNNVTDFSTIIHHVIHMTCVMLWSERHTEQVHRLRLVWVVFRLHP